MANHTRLNLKRSAGFGLVEVMVALAIGMFGVMVMMQVLSVSEEQRRTTTGGNDAMNEGVMALYALQSDVRMAGYDIADTRLLGCGLTLRAGVVLSSVAPLGGMAPVTILPAGSTFPALFPAPDPNTDGLLVFYGGSTGTPAGVTANSGNQVVTPSAFAVNDWVFQAASTRPNPCSLTLEQVSAVPIPPSTSLVVTLASGTALVPNNILFNLGLSFKAVGYAVRNGSLTMCDYTDTTKNCTGAGNWTSIANNIVSLRAQYGRDSTLPSMDGIVDVYDQTTPSVAATLGCDWTRISALRLALVARSAQFEKTAVTTAPPVWDGTTAGNPTGSAASPIVLTSTLSGTISGITAGTEWQYYRYKVFQTVVPIRNISWMGVATGC